MEQVHSRTYIIAAIITATIFVLGVLVGLVVEGKRISYVESQSRQQALDFSSLQLQFEFLGELEKEKNCPAILDTFDSNVGSLEKIRIRLESFEENSAINKDEFAMLKREYLQAQLRYYFLAKKSQELCGSDIVTTLYFFTKSEDCPSCDEQSFVLTYLKKVFDDRLLNFAFDVTIENEPMLDILKSTYNITAYPYIVVKDKDFSGLTDKDTLVAAICEEFENPPVECKKPQ